MSYVQTMEGWQTPQADGDPDKYAGRTVITTIAGEGVHILSTSDQGAYNEILYTNGKQYRRGSPYSVWNYQREASSQVARPLTPSSHLRIIQDLIDPRLVGEETIDGVRMWRIQGSVDLELKARAIWGNVTNRTPEEREGFDEPRNQMLTGSEEWTGWVRVEDGLIHAYEVNGEYPAYGSLLRFTSRLRFEFSRLNEPLDMPDPNQFRDPS